MAKGWNRKETWIALAVLAIGAIPLAIFGLHLYVTTTATLLHPDPRGVPSEPAAPPADGWADAAQRAQAVARAAMTEQNLPGLSVAVGVDGELVWAEGFGWANLEQRTPVTPSTRFRIGTASIVLTSAAVGLLAERGALDLDAAIQQYVPDYPKKQAPVTVRQLLGHTAGVITDGGDEGPLFSVACERPVDALPHFADRSLRFDPGTAYRYSSYGWILVSAAVEAAADEPFLRFMREEIFDPLDMDETRADVAHEPVPDTATPYFPRYAADPRYGLHLMRPLDLSCYAGAGAFVSTPSDLVHFALAMQSGTLLRPETVDQLQMGVRLPSGEETGYGLGWDRETVTIDGQTTVAVGHDGEVLGGTVASLLVLPDRDLVVAVTSNISYADAFGIAERVAEAFAGAGGHGPPRDAPTSDSPQ